MITKMCCDRCKKEIKLDDKSVSNFLYIESSVNLKTSQTIEIPLKEDLCGECTVKVKNVLDKIK